MEAKKCFLFWHLWSKWEVIGRARDADFGYPIMYQRKTCERCGKMKMRSIAP